MSWSVSAIGKLGPLNTEVDRQFKACVCTGSELTMCQAAHAAVSAALAAQSDSGAAMKITAWGNQATANPGNKVSNTLYITVEPIAGFLG